GHRSVATVAVENHAEGEIEQQNRDYPQQWVLEQALAVHEIRPVWPRPSLARRFVVTSAVTVLSTAACRQVPAAHGRSIRVPPGHKAHPGRLRRVPEPLG